MTRDFAVQYATVTGVSLCVCVCVSYVARYVASSDCRVDVSGAGCE
uniref:Uncharacterized protein n=1 Tax=Zea mays TaxID=4577 RepID=B6TYN2_MAIZE|nr:hypothetical protein [Zea mays]